VNETWRPGFPLKNYGRKFSETTRKSIRLEYERGLTLMAVARRFGIDVSTARKYIIDAGGAIRAKGTKGVPS
jgi:transposase-like protein